MPVASRWTMRYFACAIVLLALPVSAAAQHSWSLPSIGLPPPAPRATNPPWTQKIPWEQPQVPAWDKRQDRDRRGRGNNPHVIYLPYAIAVHQEPQVIVVQQPPVTRIVHVEIPAPQPEARVEEPRQAAPPYVPTGNRTLYVIPGCYVGNVSPINVKLPANCDITKLTTYVP